MKKRIIILLVTMLMLTMVGCSSNNKKDDIKDNDTVSDEINNNEQEPEIKEEEGILIEGKYFNLTLPAEWRDKYISDEVEDEFGYYMAFYEKTSSEEEYGGWLFSISVQAEPDFVEPSYNYIGQITIEGEEQSMLAIWPTDVQFMEETSEQYHQLAETSEEVIDSVVAANGTEILYNDDIYGSYILPGSDIRYVTEEQIKYMDKETLRLARNEIYAQHGLIFQSEDLNEYFESMEWYSGVTENIEDINLNKYEKANIELIKKLEK